jgi:hypothetical protein
MLTHLNKIVNNIESKLIVESFESQVIKDLVMQEKDNTYEKNFEDKKREISWILADARMGDIESREQFIEGLLSNTDEKEITKKELIERFQKITGEEPDLDSYGLRGDRINDVITLDIPNNLNSNVNQVLSIFDFANLKDEDIQVFEKSEFNKFNRKLRSEFSYAIGVKDNGKIIGWAEFEDDGTINNVSFLYRKREKPNFAELTNLSNKLIAIKGKFVNDSYKKRRERYNNYPYNKQETADEKNERDIVNNRDRLRQNLQKNKNDKIVLNIVKKTNEALENAKTVGKLAKEKVDDLFDDTEISEAYFKLINLFKTVKSKLQGYVSPYDEKTFDNYIKELNLLTERLKELVEVY